MLKFKIVSKTILNKTPEKVGFQDSLCQKMQVFLFVCVQLNIKCEFYCENIGNQFNNSV